MIRNYTGVLSCIGAAVLVIGLIVLVASRGVAPLSGEGIRDGAATSYERPEGGSLVVGEATRSEVRGRQKDGDEKEIVAEGDSSMRIVRLHVQLEIRGDPVPGVNVRGAVPDSGGKHRGAGAPEYRQRWVSLGQTDSSGTIAFQWSHDAVVVEGIKPGEYYGRREYSALGEGELVLVLRPMNRVRVRVMDRVSGALVGAVPVAVGVLGGQGSLEAGADAWSRKLTDRESGVAEFWNAELDTSDRGGERVAWVEIPCGEPVYQEITEAHVLGDIVVLTTPVSGEVRVRAVEKQTGRPLQGVSIRLAAYRDAKGAIPVPCWSEWGKGTTGPRGEYVVPYVGVGLWLSGRTDSVLGGESGDSRVRGPSVEGESVVVVVTIDGPETEISGRLVRANGNVWSKVMCRIEAHPSSTDWSQPGGRFVVTSNDGEFSLKCRFGARRPHGLAVRSMRTGMDPDPVAYCAIAGRDSDPRLDLGRIVLDNTRLAAAGWVAGQSGNGAGIRVGCDVVRNGGEKLPWFLLTSDRGAPVKGRFAVYVAEGWVLAGDESVRITVTGDNMEARTITGAMGRGDWEVRVGELGTVTGRLVVQEGLSVDEVRIVLGDGRYGGVAKIDEDGKFRVTRLGRGTYTLCAELMTEDLLESGRTRLLVPGIGVIEGEVTQGGRLDALELTPRYSKCDVYVVNENGRAVPRARIEVCGAPGRAIICDGGGKAAVRVPTDVHMRVSADGYRAWEGCFDVVEMRVVLRVGK